MLYSNDLNICGEVEIAVAHHLMMQDQSQEIKVIYAHQQALDQCHRWLANHYPKTELRPVASNALGARMVKDEPNAAAIASKVALNIYGLQRVAKNIEDNAGNVTRFIVIGKDEVPMGINDKTSLLVVTKYESGALFDLLEPFKDNNINMLQLARHPIPGVKWEYLFFIDIEGHQNNDNVKDAISKIKSKVSKLEILGSYPIAVL